MSKRTYLSEKRAFDIPSELVVQILIYSLNHKNLVASHEYFHSMMTLSKHYYKQLKREDIYEQLFDSKNEALKFLDYQYGIPRTSDSIHVKKGYFFSIGCEEKFKKYLSQPNQIERTKKNSYRDLNYAFYYGAKLKNLVEPALNDLGDFYFEVLSIFPGKAGNLESAYNECYCLSDDTSDEEDDEDYQKEKEKDEKEYNDNVTATEDLINIWDDVPEQYFQLQEIYADELQEKEEEEEEEEEEDEDEEGEDEEDEEGEEGGGKKEGGKETAREKIEKLEKSLSDFPFKVMCSHNNCNFDLHTYALYFRIGTALGAVLVFRCVY